MNDEFLMMRYEFLMMNNLRVEYAKFTPKS
jgi:hypothetical protein